LKNQAVYLKKKKISFISYNVWFAEKNFNIRAEGLFKILKELSPDMICLQEIIPNWIRLVVQEEWARKNYYLSDMTGSTTFPYGVMMMIRRNNGLIIPDLRLHEMPSNMGRRFFRSFISFCE